MTGLAGGVASIAALGMAALCAGASFAESHLLVFEPLATIRLGEPGPAVYDPDTRRLYVIDHKGSLEILDLSRFGLTDEALPAPIAAITFPDSRPTDAALVEGLGVAVASASPDPNAPGALSLLDRDGALLARCAVGVGPKMVAVTPDGRYALTADEGPPSPDYLVDPAGGVSIVDLALAARSGCDGAVRSADFSGFEPQRERLVADGLRVAGPFASLAQDLEPEHIAVAADGRRAWVALQENNALALLDIAEARFLRIAPLGLKDHSLEGAGLDASDSDGGVAIMNWPVLGMYQPGAIAGFQVDGQDFLASVNQGAPRRLVGFTEDVRVGELELDPARFPNAAALKEPAALGRLRASRVDGDRDGDGDLDEIHVFGGRSFSIWSADGALVFDSGDQLARAASREAPLYFNAEHGDPAEFDGLSDDQGLAPSDVAVGQVQGRMMAFIAIGGGGGGVMAFDVTDPKAPGFAGYRPGETGTTAAGQDIAEGASAIAFIPASTSPFAIPVLLLSSAESGALRLYAVKVFGG